MAGTGTGVPHFFICPVARRTRLWPEPYPKGHDQIHRTGRSRPAPRRHSGVARRLDTSHEYVCECGHRGWSCLAAVLQFPVELDSGLGTC